MVVELIRLLIVLNRGASVGWARRTRRNASRDGATAQSTDWDKHQHALFAFVVVVGCRAVTIPQRLEVVHAWFKEGSGHDASVI